MLAYVNLVQAREKELGCDVLTHQKWSGAGYIDGILGSIQSGSSGSKSMGEGNTEAGKLAQNASASAIAALRVEQCGTIANTWHRLLDVHYTNENHVTIQSLCLCD